MCLADNSPEDLGAASGRGGVPCDSPAPPRGSEEGATQEEREDALVDEDGGNVPGSDAAEDENDLLDAREPTGSPHHSQASRGSQRDALHPAVVQHVREAHGLSPEQYRAEVIPHSPL